MLLYLLQLVQALRYDALSDEEEKLTENTVDSLLQDNTESQTAETIPTQGSKTIQFNKYKKYNWSGNHKAFMYMSLFHQMLRVLQ